MSAFEQASFLRNLSSIERDSVRRIASEERFHAGDAIVSMGQQVRHLYVIATGSVRVMVPVEGQSVDEQTLAKLSAGETFGEFAFVDRQLSSAAIVADEPTRVYKIPFLDLDELLAADPELARKLLMDLLRMIVERFRSTDANLAFANYVGHVV